MAVDWLGKLFGLDVPKVIEGVAAAADRFITTDEDKRAFAVEVQRAQLDTQRLALEGERLYFEDRKSARDMYSKDNSLQKVFALTFLVGYLAMSGVMIWVVIGWLGVERVQVPEWGVALITTAFTAMSTKVATITDFFFGSSASSRSKDEDLSKAVYELRSKELPRE